MTSLHRVVTDDGVHYEHFVISSADADIRPDGEMRVRLLRPLQRVRAIRLVYAELPKTTRVLDLMLDVGTQAGRLVSQQVARSIKSNENDTQQRQAFGRIFVQDYETGDFVETSTMLALNTGTVPRFLYNNDNRNYMRYEFKPSLNFLNNINIKLQSSLLNEYGMSTLYSPSITAVKFGHALIDRRLNLDGVSERFYYPHQAAVKQFSLAQQSISTKIKKASQDTLIQYIERFIDVFSIDDYETIESTINKTGELGYLYLTNNNIFNDIGNILMDLIKSVPDVDITLQDSNTPMYDEEGYLISPLIYTLQNSPASFENFILDSFTFTLGTLYPIRWLDSRNVADIEDRPVFPYAFSSFAPIHQSIYPTTIEQENNLEISQRSRCLLSLNSDIANIVGNIPVRSDFLTDEEYTKALNVFRCKLKYYLNKILMRTPTQIKPVHGVVTEKMNVRAVNLYKIKEVLFLSDGFKQYVWDMFIDEGRPLFSADWTFAVELNRNFTPQTDLTSLFDTSVDVLPIDAAYMLNSNSGNTQFYIDSFMVARFPVTLTFEAEIVEK